jgi:hypothetical protein
VRLVQVMNKTVIVHQQDFGTHALFRLAGWYVRGRQERKQVRDRLGVPVYSRRIAFNSQDCPAVLFQPNDELAWSLT